MPDSLKPIPLVFWRSATGREPVREWLNELSREDKRTIGRDIAKVQVWVAGGFAVVPSLERWQDKDSMNFSHGKEKPAHRFELRELARRHRNSRGGDRRRDQGRDRTPA